MFSIVSLSHFFHVIKSNNLYVWMVLFPYFLLIFIYKTERSKCQTSICIHWKNYIVNPNSFPATWRHHTLLHAHMILLLIQHEIFYLFLSYYISQETKLYHLCVPMWKLLYQIIHSTTGFSFIKSSWKDSPLLR